MTKANKETPTLGDRFLGLALVVTNASRDGFLAWNRQRQKRIVDSATTREEGRAALEAHRARAQRYVNYLDRAYVLLAVASSSDPSAMVDGVVRLPDGTPRFELSGDVHGGAEGEVWCANDRLLCRRVAVKILHDDVAAHARVLLRAQRLARLSHPNVVSVFDVVTIEHPKTGRRVDALIMEYLHETLEHRLRRIVSAIEAERFAVGLLDGLEALHGVGTHHGDLHTDNVMISDGLAKLIDPGFTTATDRSPQTRDADHRSDLLMAREILMQILRSTALPRSDLNAHEFQSAATFASLRSAFINVLAQR